MTEVYFIFGVTCYVCVNFVYIDYNYSPSLIQVFPAHLVDSFAAELFFKWTFKSDQLGQVTR